MQWVKNKFHKSPNKNIWTGRVDGLEDIYQRWHQRIDCLYIDSLDDLNNKVVLIGFCCDEGVRRNFGRVGAKVAPEALRSVLANLPVHFSSEISLIDIGDIVCENEDLEGAQQALGSLVKFVLRKGGFPIVLGGGHEVTFGHFLGLQDAQSIGVINIDAHLDIRQPIEDKGSSGTGFYQIHQLCKRQDKEMHYLALGIQEISNTRALFQYAEECKVQIVENKNITTPNIPSIIQQIQEFAKNVEVVYLTIDLDAFAAPYAPGVSALAFNGIVPDPVFYTMYDAILQLPNLGSMDIAELNPSFDIDNRTARLAADLIFKALQRF